MDTDWPRLKQILEEKNYNAGDHEIISDALVTIKDAIIGSDRQKGELIANGLVPLILNLCTTNSENKSNKEDRLNALIILGSLAKGEEKHVLILTQKYNILPLLIHEIFLENNDKKCVEICLRTLRSIYENKYMPVEQTYTDVSAYVPPLEQTFADVSALTYFLSLAAPDSSYKTQVCVMRILVSICKTYEDQIRLLHAGTIHTLARMICAADEQVQLAALHCLACMCHQNRSASDNVCVTSFQGRSMPDILTTCLSRMFPAEVQLSAARCLTYIYRSGTLLASDYRIINKTLPSLARLCSDAFKSMIRSAAAETLAYLIELDIELQRTGAISNSLLKSLFQLVKYHPRAAKQAALLCYACLAANDESIRKRIMDSNEGLIDSVLQGLNDCDMRVRLASVRCLHSFSRSVQQLRTTFQDHTVWKPLVALMAGKPSDELLIVITSTICNLLLEFSPSKEPLLNTGIIKELSLLAEHKDPSLRINSVWGLMNMTFQADQRLKSDILNTLGVKRLLALLYDANPTVVLKCLGLLRNLTRNSYDVDFILQTHSAALLDAVLMILDSQCNNDIKEQVLCVIGNMAAEANNADCLMQNEKMMSLLGNYMFQSDPQIQAGAVFSLHNIVNRKDVLSGKTYANLQNIDVQRIINEINRKRSRNSKTNDNYVHRTLSAILNKLKKINQDCAEK